MNPAELGLPSTGRAGGPVPGGAGFFRVPTGIQRFYEYDLYSSVRFAAATNMNGQAASRFFSYNLGGPGPGYAGVASSISETNMQVAAMAPGNDTYEVTSLALEVYGDAAVAPLIGDLRTFMRLGILRWNFGGETTLNIAPVSMVGAAGGIFGFSADTGTPVTAANNGNGGFWVYSNVIVAIPATQAFGLVCEWGSAGQAPAINITNASQLRASLFNQARTAIPIA
jgi:hypothetical protein